MDDNTNYYKDPAKLLVELMQDTFKDQFREYYLGSPITLAESAYPCVVVQSVEANNTIQGAPTGHDLVTERINIHFLLNGDNFAQDPNNRDVAIRDLYQKVQGRDPDTGFYMTGTAMYALRTNLELKNPDTNFPTVINHDIDINYDVSREPGLPTIIEAIITIVTEERVAVPDR